MIQSMTGYGKAVVAYKEKKININDLSDTLHKVALFHLIFSAITSTRLPGLEKTYSKFARDVFLIQDKTNGKNILKTVKDRLKEKLHDISYSDFEKKFLDIKFSNKVTKDKRLIQLIFRAAEL